ncbi:MAG: flagellar hook-length control protein FliK [Myxococcota bacterium]
MLNAVRISEETAPTGGADDGVSTSPAAEGGAEASGFLEMLLSAGVSNEAESEMIEAPVEEPELPEEILDVPIAPDEEETQALETVGELGAPHAVVAALPSEAAPPETDAEEPEELPSNPRGSATTPRLDGEIDPRGPESEGRPGLPARSVTSPSDGGAAHPSDEASTREIASSESGSGDETADDFRGSTEDGGQKAGAETHARGLSREAMTEAVHTRAEAGAPKATPGPSTTSSEPTRTLPELPVVNESRILAQVRLLAREGGGIARIQLEPPHLGELQVRLTVTHDSVQMSLLADRPAVADLFTRHLPELRAALAAQGLQIDRADVEVHDHGASNESGSSSLGWEEQRSRGAPEGSRSKPESDVPGVRNGRRGPALIEDLGAVSLHV